MAERVSLALPPGRVRAFLEEEEAAEAAKREAWLAWRRAGIGASDAAGIAGISPWATPVSVWLEKVGLAADREPTEAMRFGTLLEPIILAEYESRTGHVVANRQQWVTHPEVEWMRATLDGIVYPADQRLGPGLGVLESKTSNDWRLSEWLEGVPEHYLLQVAHQIAITAHDLAFVVALVGGQRLVVHEVERDQGLIDNLMELEYGFWHKFVLPRRQPPADALEATADAIKDAFPLPTKPAVDLPVEVLDLRRQLDADEAEAKVIEERISAAKNELRLLLGEAEVGQVGDQVVATWKAVTQDRFDQDALKADAPWIANYYTKSTTHRRLHLPRLKEGSQ